MARLEVEIIGDSRSLEKAFARSTRSAKSFNKDLAQSATRTRRGFSGLTRTLGLVTGGLGVAGVAGAAKAAFEEMADSQKVAAQTAAALKSTGNAANVSAKQVGDLATALMKKSGIDDEAIQSGENLLLTFTNIRNEAGKGNDVFNQATRAITDMSVALGQDMKSSAIQVGKALQDPVRGVTALRRVGVQFTAGQQNLIKSLVESGHTLDAQKVILRELRKEFGGSAVAAGKTLPGQLNILKQTALNLGGTIAQQLSPTITAVVQRMTKWLQNSKNQKTVLDTLNAVVKAVTGTLRILKGAFDVLSKVVGGNTNAIKALVAAYAAWKIAKLIGSVAELASKFTLLSGNTKTATGSVKGLSKSMLGKAGLVGAVGVASYELTTLVLKLTGLDKKLKGVGASAYDAAASIGLVHDPTQQFKGKTAPTAGIARFLRNQAARLEQGGMTPSQAAARIAATHPGVARRDIDVYAGVTGRRPTVTINGGLHLHGVQDVRGLEQQLTK